MSHFIFAKVLQLEFNAGCEILGLYLITKIGNV